MHVQLHSSVASTRLPTLAAAPKTTAMPGGSQQDLRLQITKFEDMKRSTVAIIDVFPDPRLNVTQITVPCQNFLFGGQYELEIVGNDIYTNLDNQDERLRQLLDVRWPMPKLSVTPESIGTYPQEPVDVILQFAGIECSAASRNDLKMLPEFWLELFYCGHDVYCDSTNKSTSQVLYTEQVRGYPKTRMIKLSCELFGLAGHYIVKLRPTPPIPSMVSAIAYIKVSIFDYDSYVIFINFI